MSRRSATISVQRLAHVAIIQVGTGGTRALYPLEGHTPRALAPGRHRIGFGVGAEPRRSRPEGVRVARVCADERMTANGSQYCSWRQVGTPGGGRPPGFRYYVVLATQAPVTSSALQDAVASVGTMEDPEEATRAVARALSLDGGEARWAAYVSDAF